MHANAPSSDFFVADDFMANAYGDIGKFAYSRWYLPLVFALRAGRNAAITDIAFCDADRRKEAERVMTDAVDGLNYCWVFFEHAAEVCRQNIERDHREKGRGAENRLHALEEWSRRYRIPRGAQVQPVFRASSPNKAPSASDGAQ